jgi:hypothetical protein
MANFINACNAFHYAYEVVHYFMLPAAQCNISSRLVGISLKENMQKITKLIRSDKEFLPSLPQDRGRGTTCGG